MNLGSSLGGISLMLLAILWLAVFVPQWAKRAQEDESAPKRDRSKLGNSIPVGLSALEMQMWRLRSTRRGMGLLSLSAAFSAIVLGLLLGGTLLVFLAWITAAVSVLSGVLALAASRRLVVLAVQNSSVMTQRLSQISKAPVFSAKTTPLPRREWERPAIPKPITKQPVGELVMRGSKIVPIVDPVAPSQPAQAQDSKTSAEIDSGLIDEILRRRRAN